MTPSTASLPVTVTPQAAARIAELGFHKQVEQMVDHARSLPDVIRIEVVLNDRYDMGGEPGVAVQAWADRSFETAEPLTRKLIDWMIDSFPAEVLEHLHLAYYRGGSHAG